MNQQLHTFRFIAESFERNIPVILLYVVDSKGSSPGRQGFAMAVNGSGEMEGSIGGGVMEHKLVEMAKDMLQKGETCMMLRQQVHDKNAPRNQSGMICSGEQTILFYPITNADIAYIHELLDAMRNNENGILLFSPSGLTFSKHLHASFQYSYNYQNEQEWEYCEIIGYKNTLYIIGGGHCSLALSKTMSMLDFYIELFDDRENLNTYSRNNFVHRKGLVDDYRELDELIPGGNNSYVVVMTVGYRTDDIVVRSLMHKPFKYFGLLGSKTKVKKMLDTYRAEGIDETILKRIHAPIGLPIHSRTPEEIAISIAAEIIKVKNEEI